MQNKSPSPLGRYGKFAIYLVIVILLNVAINLTPPKKIDLTANDLFSISNASKIAVKTLNEPLTIKVFISDNLPGRYNVLEPYIRDILKEYADNANKKYFNYEFLNVGGGEDKDSAEVTANQTLASDYGISPVNIQAVEKDQLSYKLCYLGMAFIHGDIIETLTPIDTTNGLEFRITSTLQKMNDKISALLALDDNIKVNLVLSSGLQKYIPQITEIPDSLKTIIKELNKENYNKLDLVVIDPSTSDSNRQLAESLNAYYLPLELEETYYADIIITSGDSKEEVQLLALVRDIFGRTVVDITPDEELQPMINDAISAAIHTTEKIGYLTSNKTLYLDDQEQDPYSTEFQRQAEGLTNLKGVLDEEYTLTAVDLYDGTPIPEGINCLIIAGPEEQFTDYQLYQLDQFLMQGKSLAVFMDPKKIIMPSADQQYFGAPQPEYIPNNNGLDKLLEHYGIVIESSYVYDEGGYQQRDPEQGIFTLYDYPEIKNDKLNQEVEFTKNIRGTILYGVAPLTVDADKLKEKNIKAMRIFSSSDKSWKADELLTQQSVLFVTPPEDKTSFDLAYILEGKFTSYFADKPLPEKPEKQESADDTTDLSATAPEDGQITFASDEVKAEEQLISEGAPGKIFVMGSSFVLQNRLFTSELQQNMMMYLNILDYLNGKGEYAIMRTKLQQYNPLNETTPGRKVFIKVFNTWGLPVLFLLLGLFIFIRRSNKKIRLQREFARNESTQKEA